MIIINGSPSVSDDLTAISNQISAIDSKIDVIDPIIDEIDEHNHSIAKVYPSLSAGVTVTGGAGAWALGAFVEIIPANVVTLPFDIHFINIEAVSDNTTYELIIYKGLAGAEVEVGRTKFTRLSVTTANISSQPFMTPLIESNSRISAKVATLNGGADTTVISLGYHTY